MLKILYLTRVPMTAVRFIFPLANRLRERGNIVEFAFSPGERLKEMETSGFRYTVLSMNKESRSFKNIHVINQLAKVIKDGHYDVVHTYSPVIGLYGRLAAYKAKTPVVIHSVIGSLLASGVPLSHRLMYLASELTTSRMVDLFITLNDEDAHAMVKYRMTSAEKVVTLKYEYGINLNEFNPEIIDKTQLEEARKKYHFQDGIPVIGFVGRMIGAKGILDLFKAYQNLRAQGTRVKLLFLGEVASTDKDKTSCELLKDLVKESGYKDDVTLLGIQNNVPFYISLMDVVVHPTHNEGFPRIPVEAGAMGKPSICTAVSGSDVAVEEGKTGFIVPIKNPERMAEAIQKILMNPGLAREMGNAARQRVVELFDQNKIVDQQVRIYEEFFKKKKETAKYSV
jgi:glycosyltransferase involved in cell wall biosynthesis